MHAPGVVRDAILKYLGTASKGARMCEIHAGVEEQIGKVARSSIRSYLNLNTPDRFERIGRGEYRLRKTRMQA